jgi:dipeptidyl-peptidase-4
VTGYSQSHHESESSNRTVVPPGTGETLSAIYERNEFQARSFTGNWLPGTSAYTVLETDRGTGRQSIAKYDAEGGKRTELFASDQSGLPDILRRGALSIEGYQFSKDGKKLLLQLRNTWNAEENSGFWISDLESGIIREVTGGANNRIAPDGQKILFTKEGNLYVYDSKNEAATSITNDAIPGVISNGDAIWSPDGSKIAFIQSDATNVRSRSAIIPGDPSYPGISETKFARVGGEIVKLKVGIADVNGNEVRWLSIPMPTEGYYLGEVSWAGNSDQLFVEKLNRFRTKRSFLIADVNNGEITTFFEESDPDWVVASYNKNGGIEWIRDHKDYIVLSEVDGWRHAYIGSVGKQTNKLLTPGEFDIIDRVKVDEKGGWFYYNASPDNGTQKYLYRILLNGKGKPERVTPMDQPGTHDYIFSSDARWAFHTYSSGNTPPITELVQFPGHRTIRVLEDNNNLKKKVQARNVQPKEFFKVELNNGVIIDGWMIKPIDFDPSAKYPVFVYVYGEPHMQTVIDAWEHSYTEFHRAIADLGYIVISMDNRGTPCPKGASWRRAVSGSLGPLSTDEQAAALKEFGRTHPYTDLTRVGIWGWSGGGSNTLNAMFRKSDVYKVGIAVAPKPQPWLYNAWFQEIYMKTREVNPDGYSKSAPINFAEGLKGDLLIIHGTGETNTHVQITEGLVDRLIELGKPFDYMSYPNRDHGLREGKGTTLHMRSLIVRYLLQHLPPGPDNGKR